MIKTIGLAHRVFSAVSRACTRDEAVMTRPVGKIRDVAKATGLSIATVSRVMNGGKNVSPNTRDKVLAACKQLNYLPNPA